MSNNMASGDLSSSLDTDGDELDALGGVVTLLLQT